MCVCSVPEFGDEGGTKARYKRHIYRVMSPRMHANDEKRVHDLPSYRLYSYLFKLCRIHSLAHLW